VGDTIYALSSGNPPAAIAVVRISGPAAGEALRSLSGRLPRPRQASLAALRDPLSGDLLDRALTLWFPGPATATGEDLAELHLHGGRSVVAALLCALEGVGGLRAAEPGEFTRRAFENGRIDLAEAEGLADLLMAETEAQRRAALRLAGGALSRKVEAWQQCLLGLAAMVEAVLDFSDEGDVEEHLPEGWKRGLDDLTADIETMLARPPAERLRDGIRVVIAGPPNAGKSSLLNRLVGREAAITSAVAGTTRDLVEAPTAIGGAPFLLIDTAGLRDSRDEVESIGIGRARDSLVAADLILWLGPPEDCPDRGRSILIEPKADLRPGPALPGTDIRVSSETGAGIDELVAMLKARGLGLLPPESEVALNRRHRDILSECRDHLRGAVASRDPLIAAEELRQARVGLDRVTGRAGVEDMLDALFGTFCIGK
jgi:tRNA modification GTPase